MKILKISAILFFCWGINLTGFAQKIPADALKGDFDGDGKPEFAWITSNMKEQKTEDDFGQCNGGDCQCIIRFSNPKIRGIIVPQCIGSDALQNEGDLNGDGRDELSLVPSWWTSCWQACHVYTFQTNGRWRELIKPFSVYCSHLADNPDVVRSVAPKTIEIRESTMGEEIGIKTRKIKVN
ncbi:hypothetical protein SAMN05421780_101517 [Flexibacter flexilis DSM 6793]|uniref:Repeat domain-containing protein n=1 Tax=Flexibacter flexilis DSM 6793 TaxID=927664 RepID=A0A1I1DWT6_9BACT|nr:hypothetical protein [Flexibacter flexilis]SFB79519.1 hypothetical protein SAMN05421780_101517 [Flexibacter flexilis DSM 6793]